MVSILTDFIWHKPQTLLSKYLSCYQSIPKKLMIILLAGSVIFASTGPRAGEINNLEDAQPVYSNILRNCGATHLRLHKDLDILIIGTRGVDLNCFYEKLSSHDAAKTDLVGRVVDSLLIQSNFDNSKVKLVTYRSLFAEKGGEIRIPSNENIIIDKDNLHFVLSNQLGVSTKLIKKNMFLVIVDGSHYDQNYLFNYTNASLVNLGAGRIEFEREKIKKYLVKGYLTNRGGAFWFNLSLNYQGKYLELLDIKNSKACYPLNRFSLMSDKFITAFKNQKLKQLCVLQK